MDNNFLQTLQNLLSKNGQTAPATQSSAPLYPMEAYPQSPSADANANAQGGLLPLLLALMGQNGGEGLSALCSQSANPELANILSLFSSLPKKKKEETKEEEKSVQIKAQPTSFDGAVPDNEILF